MWYLFFIINYTVYIYPHQIVENDIHEKIIEPMVCTLWYKLVSWVLSNLDSGDQPGRQLPVLPTQVS